MAWQAGERRRPLVILGIATCLAAAYFAALFLFIPIGTEARDYIFHNGFLPLGGNDAWRALSFLMYPTGADSRLVSRAVFALSHQACGLNAPCLNGIQIAILLAAFAAGAWHMQQLLGRPLHVSIAMLFWAVSLPVFSAGYWQATQHDKLAFLFAFSALGLGLATLRKNPPQFPLGRSLGVIGLVILAVNSKEMAFFLPAAMVAQIAFLAPGTTIADKLRAARVYAAPLAFTVFYIAVYMARLHGSWKLHVASGSLADALSFYAGSLAGFHPTSLAAMTFLAILLALSIAMGTRWRRSIGAGYGAASLYLLAIFMSSIALVARAQYPADYYLLVPLWALLAWIANTVAAARVQGWMLRLPVLTATAMLASCFAAGRYADDRSQWGSFQQLRDARQLYRGYTFIRATCRDGLQGGLKLAFRRRPVGEWWYFRGLDERPDQLVGAYICQDGQVPAMAYALDGNNQQDHPGQQVIQWDETLTVTQISKQPPPK